MSKNIYADAIGFAVFNSNGIHLGNNNASTPEQAIEMAKQHPRIPIRHPIVEPIFKEAGKRWQFLSVLKKRSDAAYYQQQRDIEQGLV